jgi:CarD family transcriptional regulator, regulator of rRNA transcription
VSVPLPLAGREPGLDLSVGAVVVYGSHGIGRVSARNPGNRGEPAGGTVALEFESGLSVILPLERAEACLRPIADARGLEDVRAALCARDVPIEPAWQARSRTTRTKLAAGEPVGLAEVVRDGVERRRRSTTGSTPSPAEQELYRKARQLLVTELVLAAGMDETEAERWIDDQLHRDEE